MLIYLHLGSEPAPSHPHRWKETADVEHSLTSSAAIERAQAATSGSKFIHHHHHMFMFVLFDA